MPKQCCLKNLVLSVDTQTRSARCTLLSGSSSVQCLASCEKKDTLGVAKRDRLGRDALDVGAAIKCLVALGRLAEVCMANALPPSRP